jgi:hypothetical protein
MLRKHASLIIAGSLIALVATACIIKTHPAPRGRPVYVEKHKPQKHKHEKHKPEKHHKHKD